MAITKDNIETYPEFRARQERHGRTFRRALAGSLIVAASLGAIPTGIPQKVIAEIRGIHSSEDYKPAATEANIGGHSSIKIKKVKLEDGRDDYWPHIRSDPSVQLESDSGPSNEISWSEVAAVNEIPIDAKPDTEIHISGPTFVTGTNADNAAYDAEKQLWAEVKITKKNGSVENGYFSTSNQTEGFVEIALKGPMIPINQPDVNITDKLNITTITSSNSTNP